LSKKIVVDLKEAGDSKWSLPPRTPTPAARPPRRISPPAGVLKVNADAAVSNNTGCSSVAAVARNDQGVFLGASARVFPGKTEAETLEAMACREAVDLTREIGAQKVMVASDCRNVVASLEQGTMGAYAHIGDEMMSFQNIDFPFDSRLANKEAHNLARSVVRDTQGHRLWLKASLSLLSLKLNKGRHGFH
jgi:ribonuclease HI